KISNGFDIISSALTANRLRMDVASSNIANAETTRGSFVNGEFVPSKRKMVVVEPSQPSFSTILNKTVGGIKQSSQMKGIHVTKIIEDTSPTNLVYNPTHPDANAEGYVQ